MAHPSAAWGIEIGQFAIKAIRLERSGDDVEVTDFAVVPHRKVLTTPGIDPDEVTRLSLGQLISEKNLEGEHLVVSVPGHSAFARFAKLPPVEAKNLPDIVRFEAVQQIPFPIEEVEWDYEAFQSVDSPEVEVGIFAITRDRVNARLDVYGEVGLSPETLTLSPVAVFNAMHYDNEPGADADPVVYIDIGTEATDVIIMRGKQCWIRTFPLGGTKFTEAIADSFKISYEKAERLKREAASSKYAKQIMQAMRPVFAELLQELQRSLSYASDSGELTEMVGAGSTFKIPGLRKFLGQQLQVNVTRLDEYKRIDVTGREAASFAEHCVNMATAYGLALRGVGLAQIDINLVPAAVLREQLWHSKSKWFVAAACIVIAGAGLTLLGPFMQQRKLSGGSVPPQVRQTIKKGEELKKSFAEAMRKGQTSTDAAQIVALLDYRNVWPWIVTDCADALAAAGPEDRILTLSDFLDRYPEVAGRDMVRLQRLDGEYLPPAGRNERPRIAVTMEVQLDHADPVNFLNDTVASWLRSNAQPEGDRAGAPYVIDKASVSCNPDLLVTTEIPPAVAAAPSSGNGPPYLPESGSRGRGSGGGSPKLGGGPGRGGSGGPKLGGGPGRDRPGAPAPSPGAPKKEAGDAPSEPVTPASLDSVAPTPQRPELKLSPPGSTNYVGTVTFEVEILPQPHQVASP